MAYKAIFLRSPPRTDCTAQGRCSRISKALGLVWLPFFPSLFETIFLLNLPSLKVTRTTGGERELLQPPSLLVSSSTAASSGISFEGRLCCFVLSGSCLTESSQRKLGLPFISSSPPLLPATTTPWRRGVTLLQLGQQQNAAWLFPHRSKQIEPHFSAC